MKLLGVNPGQDQKGNDDYVKNCIAEAGAIVRSAKGQKPGVTFPLLIYPAMGIHNV